jgi:predicted Fe-S protein YdhL (DUF1289 family)
MAFFPKIQSPCPYKGNIQDIMDGDICSLCHREVFELNGMSDQDRTALLSGCEGEICVSYKFKLPTAIAAAALAAASVAMPAMAQDAPAAAEPTYEDDFEIFVGGIKDKANIEMIEDAADNAIPELPVAFEEDAVSDAKPAA